MIIFGAGVITMTPNNVTNPTPLNVGLAQEISYEESFTTKTLYGQYRRAIAIGAGEIKASGKIKAARFSSSLMAMMLYGQTIATGETTTAFAEPHSVPAASTYTVTVTNSATFTTDQGVIYAATGFPLTRVATVTAIGQYSVSAGVYTFYSGDASAAVLISYNYTVSSSGYNIALGNPLIGPTISFGLNIMTVDPTNNKVGVFQVYNAVVTKFAMGTKLSDFAMPEYDYESYANAANNYGQWNFPDPS